MQKYPYSHPAQFVGLRLWVLIDPELSRREPVFSKVAWPTSVSAWNKEQIKARFRIDPGYECPKGYPAVFECHKCPHGFKTCRAGTHREEWTEGPCPECGKEDAYFDPEISDDICIDCYVTKAFKGERK
jgi:hypothetical protein